MVKHTIMSSLMGDAHVSSYYLLVCLGMFWIDSHNDIGPVASTHLEKLPLARLVRF